MTKTADLRDSTFHQCLLQVRPDEYREPVEHLADTSGIANLLTQSGKFLVDPLPAGESPKFTSSMMFELVQELLWQSSDDWYDLFVSLLQDMRKQPNRFDIHHRWRWQAFPYLNKIWRDTNLSVQHPEAIAMNLQDELELLQEHGRDPRLILCDIEDTFMPRLYPLGADGLTAKNRQGGLTLKDINPHCNLGRNPNLKVEFPVLEHQIPTFNADWMYLLAACNGFKYTDWSLKYILLPGDHINNPGGIRCTDRKFYDRHTGKQSGNDVDVLDPTCALSIDLIGSGLISLVAGLGKPVTAVHIHKNFNNWLYVELGQGADMVRYGVDLTLVSLISHDLSYLE